MNPDAREKDGIGKNLYPEEIDQNGRVSDPRGGNIVVAPIFGCRMCERGSDGSPTLHDPFVPKVPQPAASPYFLPGTFPFRFHREQ